MKIGNTCNYCIPNCSMVLSSFAEYSQRHGLKSHCAFLSLRSRSAASSTAQVGDLRRFVTLDNLFITYCRCCHRGDDDFRGLLGGDFILQFANVMLECILLFKCQNKEDHVAQSHYKDLVMRSESDARVQSGDASSLTQGFRHSVAQVAKFVCSVNNACLDFVRIGR